MTVLIYDNGSFKPCNLSCKYCRDKPSKKTGNDFLDPIRGLTKTEEYRIYTKDILKKLAEKTRFNVHKISGHGEISLLPNFIEILDENHVNIIITNGTLLDEKKISILAEKGNIVLNFSLDGHLPNMNHYRFKSSSLTDKILHNVDLSQDYGIQTEINCVLSKANVKQIKEYIEFLSTYDNLMVFPFPVRKFSTKENNDYILDKSNLVELTTKLGLIVDSDLDAISSNYMKSLLRFLEKGKKSECILPFLTISVNYAFDLLYCPCGPTNSYGNLLTNFEGSLERYFKQRNSIKSQISSWCRNCFTPYEIINLYISDEITDKEIRKVPSFSFESSYMKLKKIKSEILKVEVK